MIRRALLALSQSERGRRLSRDFGPARAVVDRYVAGEDLTDLLRVARELSEAGMTISAAHLGEHARTVEGAQRAREDYLHLIAALGGAEPGRPAAAPGLRPDVSVKMSALGQGVPGRDLESTAAAVAICSAARNAALTVTLDMEDSTTTTATLRTLRRLRADFPDVGVAVQAALRRSEDDCEPLAAEGVRVRLCKGAYAEPAELAFPTRSEVDLSYVRCLKILLAGRGYPMVATHDTRLLEIAADLARRAGRRPGDYEFQMLYGVRPPEERRLVAAGETVRVYVPYGTDWYGYLLRRLAERPANLGLFLRSVVART